MWYCPCQIQGSPKYTEIVIPLPSASLILETSNLVTISMVPIRVTTESVHTHRHWTLCLSLYRVYGGELEFNSETSEAPQLISSFLKLVLNANL